MTRAAAARKQPLRPPKHTDTEQEQRDERLRRIRRRGAERTLEVIYRKFPDLREG